MHDSSLNRRRFLAMAGGTAALLASGGALAACGTSTPSAGPGGPSGIKLPDYVPAELVKADLPATADGIMAGYYGYPQNLVNGFSAKPGDGLGKIHLLTNILTPVPPAAGSNSYWQELNSRIGATVDITMTPQADYLNKLSTIIASGDLPDMVMISARLARRADVLTRLCADISEFVSGPAVRKYPFLANVPTDSWLATAYGKGIFAVPIPRAVVGTIFFSRADLIAGRGLNPAPGSYSEFAELARGMTDARSNKWAFGTIKQVIYFVGNMLGVPNVWRESGGKFTSEHETPERKQAIAKVAELYKEGLFHPDTAGGRLQARDLFGNGTLAFNPDGYAAWDTLSDTYKVQVGGIAAPGFDGGQGTTRAGTANFALTAFKKADKGRIEQLLRVCDWLAAPLGTSEYMFRKFGAEGKHFTWNNGVPTRTALGGVEVKLPLEYICDAPHILGPGNRTRIDAQRAYQEKALPKLARNPGEGLYSETSIAKTGELSKIIDNAELDIVTGRKPVSHWDEAVSAWRKAGGDEMRAEYEAALAERK